MTPATTAPRPATHVPLSKGSARPHAPVEERAPVPVRAAEAVRSAARANPATACDVGNCIRLRGHDGLHRDTDGTIIDGPIRSWAMER